MDTGFILSKTKQLISTYRICIFYTAILIDAQTYSKTNKLLYICGINLFTLTMNAC